VVVLGLGVALFPIWYRIARKLVGLARRGRRGNAAAEPMEATA
jgi:hypothetical protein